MAPRPLLPVGAIVLAAVSLGAAAIWTRTPVIPEERVTQRPIQTGTDGYVSSSACQACIQPSTKPGTAPTTVR